MAGQRIESAHSGGAGTSGVSGVSATRCMASRHWVGVCASAFNPVTGGSTGSNGL
jgi:hypothetical protein